MLCIGHVFGEDAPQPDQPFPVAAAAEPLPILVRFQQRLLDQAGGFDLAPRPRSQLQPGQQVELGAEASQRRPEVLGSLIRTSFYCKRAPFTSRLGTLIERIVSAGPAMLPDTSVATRSGRSFQ